MTPPLDESAAEARSLAARILAVSSHRLPDVVASPEQGIAWVATRDPDFPAPETGDRGIITRFALPADE